ncbi:hypothetical protein [Altericroceibacterium xinjiangense]|uniref:hypothetical protein n=1 Tax=Altericroceibacterium xinjiangense TaxID=762261 RepID=UPI0013DF1483|nr:hypothetical protein [Altericroceibacterium xinjiangense]
MAATLPSARRHAALRHRVTLIGACPVFGGPMKAAHGYAILRVSAGNGTAVR